MLRVQAHFKSRWDYADYADFNLFLGEGLMAGWSIGEVATRAGLRPSALRYYEQEGLLAPQPREGGQRRYDPSVLNTLALIGYAKGVGFTVRETKLLLSGFERDIPPSTRWRTLAQRKQKELEAIIDKAHRMRHLLEVVSKCKCITLEECGRRLRARSSRL